MCYTYLCFLEFGSSDSKICFLLHYKLPVGFNIVLFGHFFNELVFIYFVIINIIWYWKGIFIYEIT